MEHIYGCLCMELEGWKPDKVAFLTVLSACMHGGSVEQGILFFLNDE